MLFFGVKKKYFLLGALFALAACGDLPRPFAPGQDAAAEPLAGLADGAGIRVEPVRGAPAAIAGPLADSLARALRDLNIPATTRDDYSGAFSLGALAAAAGPPSPVRANPIADLTWTLTGPGGKVKAVFEQKVNGPRAGWAEGDPRLIARIVADAAPPIVKMIQGDDDLRRADRPRPPSVALAPVTGLEGGRAEALLRAIRFTLKKSGAVVVAETDNPDFTVAGGVEFGALIDGARTVAITWLVRDAEGAEIGKIRQNNSLSGTVTDRQWAEITLAVAAGATEGFAELLERVGAPER